MSFGRLSRAQVPEDVALARRQRHTRPMKFGICAPFSSAPWLQKCGYDYFEPSVCAALEPERPEGEVMPALLRALQTLTVRPEAWNGFLPGNLKVVGPDQDAARQQAFVTSALKRAAMLGTKIVVFGSGAARSVPPGYEPELALQDLTRFLSMAAEQAQACKIVIAIEPLNSAECNIINSVGEAVELAKRVDQPAVQVLSDLFHVARDGQSYVETALAGSRLVHVHIATPLQRHAPGPDDADFLREYFGALRQAGYDGRVSIEGGFTDFEAQSQVALAVMRQAWDDSFAG